MIAEIKNFIDRMEDHGTKTKCQNSKMARKFKEIRSLQMVPHPNRKMFQKGNKMKGKESFSLG